MRTRRQATRTVDDLIQLFVFVSKYRRTAMGGDRSQGLCRRKERRGGSRWLFGDSSIKIGTILSYPIFGGGWCGCRCPRSLHGRTANSSSRRRSTTRRNTNPGRLPRTSRRGRYRGDAIIIYVGNFSCAHNLLFPSRCGPCSTFIFVGSSIAVASPKETTCLPPLLAVVAAVGIISISIRSLSVMTSVLFDRSW